MNRRNTISREFFATIAAVLVLGLSVMCAIQTALSAAYFISERRSSLTDVLNGAAALSERFADEGSIVTKPLQGDDILERAHSGYELFNTASGALVFIADENGQILLHSRILCFGKKREKCSGYGQQRRQRRGDRLRGAAERGKFVARILRRQEQQQRIFQRLRIGADADAAGHHGQHGRACVQHFRQCRVLR